MATKARQSSPRSRVKVFVRVRPPLEKDLDCAIDAREFTYDAVFPPNASQSDVFCQARGASLHSVRQSLRVYSNELELAPPRSAS
eukprot:s5003_g7.t1